MIRLLLLLTLLSKELHESGALYLRQHPFKWICNEATNCNDICNGIGEQLQPRHCFKGTCVNDTIIDCEATLQSCKSGTPDDECQ